METLLRNVEGGAVTLSSWKRLVWGSKKGGEAPVCGPGVGAE